jgi:predicted CoA-substrate-specific enzyme activase
VAVVLGVDIGSVTVKVVILDAHQRIRATRYVRSRGRPRLVLLETLRELRDAGELTDVLAVGLSGSGGGPIADMLGGHHVNELVAQARAIELLHPEARTVIEIGGQDSKLLALRIDDATGRLVLHDFAMNALCAAGTGAFLDQQADRLGIQIEKEWEALALQSTSPARIAGRCTVFAKSDMIHLQQHGVPMPDILMGVCLALARNFKTVIGKGRRFVPPIVFQGGVASNAAVTRAFEMVLGLSAGAIVIPEHHTFMPALGTAFAALDEYRAGTAPRFRGIEALDSAVREEMKERRVLPVLHRPAGNRPAQPRAGRDRAAGPLPVWIGVDVGSISTKVVLVDETDRLVARWYALTAGRPLEAVRDGLGTIGAEVGDAVVVRGAGTTGSGRHLVGDFIGADAVRNEITAQTRAAVAIDPEVDTIIEIGGQDSKFMRVDGGAVVDFAMNNACAAGTGSFLEEQADRLRIDIAGEFADRAFASACPAALGERCTVFMESDLVHHQQQGAEVADLTAGLSYSIAENYLNRVVNGRSLGRRVFFQGAVASNEAVVAAFATRTGRAITVPRDNDVTGAVGAAILAREAMAARARRHGTRPTRFRGFDLADRTYAAEVFECKACPNLCEVNRVTIGQDAPIFYGARCDRFEDAGRHTQWQQIPDPFAERDRVLLAGWTPPEHRNGKPRVAMSRTLLYYDMFPFWRGFFETLGLEIVLSDATNPRILQRTRDEAAIEACFPVKLAFGHHAELLALPVDFVFAPGVMTRESVAPGQPHRHACPMVAAVPQLLRANHPPPDIGPCLLTPTLHLDEVPVARRQLRRLAAEIGASGRDADRAVEVAFAAQDDFRVRLARYGRELLASLDGTAPGAVVVGRPYNVNDLGANLDLPLKLRKIGVIPIPMDLLPLDDVSLPSSHADMFWRSGQDILRAGTLLRDDPRLHTIYITNFNCGPDSFLLSFFRERMGSKPFLELEVDEHTADAGLITRCEAFFDSLGVHLEDLT